MTLFSEYLASPPREEPGDQGGNSHDAYEYPYLSLMRAQFRKIERKRGGKGMVRGHKGEKHEKPKDKTGGERVPCGRFSHILFAIHGSLSIPQERSLFQPARVET